MTALLGAGWSPTKGRGWPNQCAHRCPPRRIAGSCRGAERLRSPDPRGRNSLARGRRHAARRQEQCLPRVLREDDSMRARCIRVLGLAVAMTVALVLPAAADHATRPHTPNLHAKGHSPHPATFLGATSAQRTSTPTSPSGASWRFTETMTGSGSSTSRRPATLGAGDLLDPLQRRPGRHRCLGEHPRSRMEQPGARRTVL